MLLIQSKGGPCVEYQLYGSNNGPFGKQAINLCKAIHVKQAENVIMAAIENSLRSCVPCHGTYNLKPFHLLMYNDSLHEPFAYSVKTLLTLDLLVRCIVWVQTRLVEIERKKRIRYHRTEFGRNSVQTYGNSFAFGGQ